MRIKLKKITANELYKYPNCTTDRWVNAIKLAQVELKKEPCKAELLKLKFFEKMPEEKIQEKLYISRNTYFTYKNDCIIEVIFQALNNKAIKL